MAPILQKGGFFKPVRDELYDWNVMQATKKQRKRNNFCHPNSSIAPKKAAWTHGCVECMNKKASISIDFVIKWCVTTTKSKRLENVSYLAHGKIEISNNQLENAMHPYLLFEPRRHTRSWLTNTLIQFSKNLLAARAMPAAYARRIGLLRYAQYDRSCPYITVQIATTLEYFLNVF